jgi:hypothetical protein
MKRARRGTIAAGYFKLLPVFMFLIPGMVAAALAARPDSGFTLDNPDTAFGAMVKFVLQPVERHRYHWLHLGSGGFIGRFLQLLRHSVHGRLLQT